MTIHPNHSGLTAEIVVHNQALEEYDDDNHNAEPESNVVTKYVRVDPDARFAVRYTIPRGLTGAIGIQCSLKIDRYYVHSRNHFSEQILHRSITRNLDTFYGTVGGVNYMQKFRFSEIQIDYWEAVFLL